MTKKVLSKRISAIASLAVAPALLLLGGCGSSKNNTTPTQQAVVSQIIGASSPGLTVNTQSGSLPSSNSNGAAAPTASVLSVSPVNGGGSQVVLSVTTPQPVDEILIGVPNSQGFYDIVVNPTNATRAKQVTVATQTTTYQVTLITTGAAASSLGSITVETRTGGVVSQAATVSMVLTAPAAPSRVVYELSNLASGNSVIAYRNDGSGNLSLIGSYPDGGTGVQGLESVGPSAAGALTLNFFHDKDNPVISNPQHTLMFVANQGSDNISVMRINADGSVTPVPGSPFASNGRAPVSVAVVNNGNTLVVVNKNQLAAPATQPVTAVNELGAPGPNVSSFNISSTGTLSSAVSKIALPVGSLPTQVLAAPASLTTNGSVVFVAEEGPNGAMVGYQVASNGTLTSAQPNGVTLPPTLAANILPVQMFYLGMGVHPTKQLLYVNAPMTEPATLLVYSYDSAGNLTFVNSVGNPGRAACWIAIDPTGSYLYTTNTLDDTVTEYNIAGNNATTPVMIGSAPFLLSQAKGRGTTYEVSFDATGSFLFVNSPNNLGAVPDAVVANQFDPIPGPNGPGNTLHTLILNKSDGTLSEAPGSPVLVPVPGNANPEGVLAF